MFVRLPVLPWNFQAHAESGRNGVSGTKIKNVDVRIVFRESSERTVKLLIAFEIVIGMKVSIRPDGDPLARLEIRRLLGFSATAIDGTPTGHHTSA